MEPAKDYLAGVLAQLELAREGSVMAQPPLPQWRKDNPLVDTLLTILLGEPSSSLSSSIAPPMGGALKSIITPVQRQILKAIHRRDPQLLRAVGMSPRKLLVSTDIPPAPGSEGTYYSGPGVDAISLRPGILAGRSMEGKPLGPARPRIKSVMDTPSVAVHEALHFLNEPRVLSTDPVDAETIAGLIYEFLPKTQGVRSQIGQPLQWGQGRKAMHEALSYLGQHATSPKYSSDPMLRALYEALRPTGLQ